MKVGDAVTLIHDMPIHNHATMETMGTIPSGTRGMVTERVMQGEKLYWYIALEYDVYTKSLPYLDSVITTLFRIEEKSDATSPQKSAPQGSSQGWKQETQGKK